MRKLLFGMYVLMATGFEGMAQTVTVEDVEAVPGETVAFLLSLSGGRTDTYTALTFDAQFPTTGFSTTGDYTVSSSWGGAIGVVGDVGQAGVATIPFASANTIAAGNDLVTVSFKVGKSVALGTYDVLLKNILLEYDETGKDYAANASFKVNVVNAHTVVLDETSTTVPENATRVNAQVKRTLNAGKWNTICLPFAMTNDQLKTAFGNKVKLGDFSNWWPVRNANGDIEKIAIGFNEVTELTANHPYIIRPSTTVKEFTVPEVNITVAKTPTVTVTNDEGNKGRLIGTYKANTKVPNNDLFLSKSVFAYSNGSTKLKAFNAYFDLPDVLAEAGDNAAERLVLTFDKHGGVTTGISNAERQNNNEVNDVYDLMGRKVSDSRAKKGVYIRNGRKVVVK